MIWFFRFLLGYVDFAFVGGFCEEFLTDCFEQGIEIRDIAKTEYGFVASCKISTYKKIHHIAFYHGGRIKVLKKHGLPFILKPLKNRYGFAVGALAFVLIISLLNSFVWKIEFVGNETISDTSLSTFLENNSFKVGTMWSSANRDNLCWELMAEYDNIAWAHINRQGALATVEINEKTPVPEEADEDNLKGISVFRQEISVIAYREQRKLNVAKTKNYKTLYFFGVKIPLYISYSKGNISEASINYLTIKNVELPIGIQTNTEKFLNYDTSTLDDEDLKALAYEKLTVSEKQKFEDYEIINKTESIDINSDRCQLNASYIIRRK